MELRHLLNGLTVQTNDKLEKKGDDKMSNKVYDILNKIQRWLPALGVFYLAIAAIWHLPLGDEENLKAYHG